MINQSPRPLTTREILAGVAGLMILVSVSPLPLPVFLNLAIFACGFVMATVVVVWTVAVKLGQLFHLIKECVNPGAIDGDGRNALHRAVLDSPKEYSLTVRILLWLSEKHAHLTSTEDNDHRLPLYYAFMQSSPIRKKHSEIVVEWFKVDNHLDFSKELFSQVLEKTPVDKIIAFDQVYGAFFKAILVYHDATRCTLSTRDQKKQVLEKCKFAIRAMVGKLHNHEKLVNVLPLMDFFGAENRIWGNLKEIFPKEEFPLFHTFFSQPDSKKAKQYYSQFLQSKAAVILTKIDETLLPRHLHPGIIKFLGCQGAYDTPELQEAAAVEVVRDVSSCLEKKRPS